MRADEITIDETTVRRLLTAQFPEWAGLPLRPFASGGIHQEHELVLASFAPAGQLACEAHQPDDGRQRRYVINQVLSAQAKRA